MQNFKSKQRISLSRNIKDKKRFEVLEDIFYKNIIIHEGFKTDGASIKFGRYAVGCPFEGVYLGPAIVHDMLYVSKKCSRKEADKEFKEALLDVGVSKLKANVMYYAVRMFGRWPWENYTEEEIYTARQFLTIIPVSYGDFIGSE